MSSRPGLLERLRGLPGAQDALDAARALELARELFVLAACKPQLDRESNERLKATIHNPNPPALVRARQRVEKRRAEALEHFNRSVGL